MATGRERLRLLMLRAWARAWRPRRKEPLPSEPHPRRILVIRPDHLGDLLFTGPALRYLRAIYPEAEITALVGPWGRGVAERLPGLDGVLTCPFPGFSREPKGSPVAPYRLLWREAARLRDFDLAIILRFDHWWGALLAHTAGIPHRWGYAIAECRPFLTRAIRYEPGHHEAEQNLRLLQGACGRQDVPLSSEDLALAFAVKEEERQFAGGYLAGQGIGDHGRLVAIHPGAGAPVKLWPAERYAQMADALADEFRAKIVITGSAGELGLAWKVAALMRANPVVAAGETSLGQLAALLGRCSLALGSDSGPLHLAVAMGTPTVHMYGPADPAKFGPWAPRDDARHIVLVSPMSCVPCERLDYGQEELGEHPCMQAIGVDKVLEAARGLLH